MLEPTLPSHNLDTSGAHARRANVHGAPAHAVPDLLLIERARAGDERAIESLIRRYGRRLFRVAHSLLGDEERSEAAVREACLAAFGDLSRYEPTGKFAAWLTRLAFVQARALRCAGRPAGHTLEKTPGPAPAAPADSSPGDEQLQERREVERAIGQLPEVFRTVFVLRFIEGVSGIETAASLAVHETTVRTRLYRAQRRLGADMVRRARATAALFAPSSGSMERLVAAVLTARSQGSMLTISASTP